MPEARFTIATDAVDQWRDDVLSGSPPIHFPIGNGDLATIEIGPKLITLFGGAPGAGKTGFIMQAVFDALRITSDLRAVVCNVEMPASVLLDRQLSRLSGVSLDIIRHRRFTEKHTERIESALDVIDSVSDRIAFVRPPFDLANVAATVDKFAPLGSGSHVLLVLDYIQRIAPPGNFNDRRGSVDATMNYIRQFADAGAAVIVVAAVGRQKDSKGRSSYDGDALSLASFRESSELEFGADDAFILTASKQAGFRTLRHLKARHRRPCDIEWRFHGATQSFVASENFEMPKRESMFDAWNDYANDAEGFDG